MAQIAQAAGLPKANLHYYFGTKEQLYQAVLTAILELWLDASHAAGDKTPAEGPLAVWRDASGKGRHLTAPEADAIAGVLAPR